jgi:hypothetical protein
MERLFNVDAALGRRLKERRPEALGKLAAIRSRNLARILEIALQKNESTRSTMKAARRTTNVPVPRHSASSSKRRAARGAGLVCNNHDGQTIGVLHTQNMFS